jgi:hypothetical protein
MRSYARQRSLLSAVLAGVTGLAVLVLSAGPASAAPGRSLGPVVPVATADLATATVPAGAVKVRLSLNCTNMSAGAYHYAVEHNLCPAASGPGTQTLIWGNCGAAWAFIYDDVSGDGVVRYNWGAFSTLGVIVHRSFLVDWTFTPVGSGAIAAGTLADSGFWFSSYYEANATGAFGPGAASILLRGTATLVWGGVCEVLPPNPRDFRPAT